jgi:GrpB-like predicted nucleotidyltransferase (UPF0157 family)
VGGLAHRAESGWRASGASVREPRNKPVEIIDYDPRWPQAFADLKAVLLGRLGDLALEVEHVGSTAVPGLCAKPIIDLDVVIANRQSLPEVIRRLAGLGYAHEGDLGIAGREAFARSAADVPRDGRGRTWPEHHLYVCDKNSNELRRHLAFRDALRADPDRTAAYGRLKRELASRFRNDREAYGHGKSEFIERVLRQAKD